MEFVSDEEGMTTKHEVHSERVFTSVQQLSTSRPRRVLDLAAAVACVACVLTLVACGLTVHIYVKMQTRNFRDELAAIVREEVRAGTAGADTQGPYTDNQEGNYASQEIELAPEEGSVPKRKRTAPDDQNSKRPPHQGKRQRNDNKERPNKRNQKNKKDKCCRTIKKELGSMIQDAITSQLPDLINRTVDKALYHIQGSNEDNKHLIGIDHFTTVVDENFILQKIGKYEAGNSFKQKDNEHRSVEMPEWSGTLYRNRSLRISEAPTTLKMFAPTNTDSQRLFDFDRNTGLFKARFTGLYHIYAHVPFHVDESMRSDGEAGDGAVRLVHTRYKRRHNSLRCQEVTRADTARTINNGPFEACNINGVLHLKQG